MRYTSAHGYCLLHNLQNRLLLRCACDIDEALHCPTGGLAIGKLPRLGPSEVEFVV